MIKELNEFIEGGLKKHIATYFTQTYFAIVICILIAYLMNHWLLKEISIILCLSPLIGVFVGLPLLWYFNIKPISDKQLKNKRKQD